MALVSIASTSFFILLCEHLCFSCRPLSSAAALIPCFDLVKKILTHGRLSIVSSLIDTRLCFLFCSCFSFHDHFILSAQNAADILPFAMFFACLALKDFLLFFIAWLSPFFGAPAVEAPCCPNLIVLILSPCFATTMWDFFGWLGVRFGLLNPVTPALVSLGSFFRINFALNNWESYRLT
mgnify:CR=1 FL=1